MWDNFKARLLSGWGFTRIVRLVLGVVILIQAFQMGDAIFALLGSLFFGQAVLGVGCCGPQGCGVPMSKNADDEAEKEITYEEIGKEKK